MKRKAKPVFAPTMESAANLVREIVACYVAPRLLKGKSPLLTWSFGLEHFDEMIDAYVLTFMPREETGVMVQSPRPSTTRFYQLASVDPAAVTNALFYALSYPGSPYYWDAARWQRKSYIYG